MEHPAGEASEVDLRVAFDRRIKLEFHGSKVTSDAGLLAFRELDAALGLTEIAAECLADRRSGQNSRHTLIAQLRQSVFGRLAGYEDVNDADRLAHDPAMRWIVGGRAVTHKAASASQMGRFETEGLAQEANLLARGPGAGDRPLPDQGEAALLPRRRGLRLARGLRVPGSRGLRLRNPPAGQRGLAEEDRASAQAPAGPPTARGPALLRQLPLSGPELEPLTPGRGQGRVAPRRALSA